MQIKKSGIEFEKINGVIRSVYRQLDGSVELADVCTCIVERAKNGLHIIRNIDCPIDQHKIAAREGVA